MRVVPVTAGGRKRFFADSGSTCTLCSAAFVASGAASGAASGTAPSFRDVATVCTRRRFMLRTAGFRSRQLPAFKADVTVT